MVLPTIPTETADPASAATDHKITLRPVTPGADPVQPEVSSDAVQPQPVMTAVTPAEVPNTTLVAAPSQAHSASPATQVAPALLTLAKTANGSQQMTVRLQPADLGMVQVRIARAVSGTTQIEITADEPATLLALQRDQPQLHRTLDEAGIPAAGRTVTFHVAQAAQQPRAATARDHRPATEAANRVRPAERVPERPTQTARPVAAEAATRPGSGPPTPPPGDRAHRPRRAARTGATAGKSYRIGLDITA